MSARVRSWRLHRRVNSTGAELAGMINPVVRGWMAYYGAFYHSALHPLLHCINTYLLRWIMHTQVPTAQHLEEVHSGDERRH